jgi:uncharacterized protein (DUF433 family)
MIPSELDQVLVSTPDTLGGSVRFAGTRVPLRALLDTLAEGDGLPQFLEGWPDVTRSQASMVIGWLDRNNRKIFGLDDARLTR